MNPRIIAALTLRYLFLYTRSWVRGVEVVFWPMMDLLVWGYLTVFLQKNAGGTFPQFITFLIGAMIFWDVLFRSQQAVAISFLEDIWTRNLLNVFTAPIRITEFLSATFVVGLIRVFVTVLILGVLSKVMYAFNLLDFKFTLLLFFANLLLFGWALGMVSTALITRWGQAAEGLAWAVPFLIQPVSAVFYPVSVLPHWLQKLAWIFPTTHVFEGMREVLANHDVPWDRLAWAFGLNLVYLALAGTFFSFMLSMAREKGLLTKLGTQ
jgi:ABC-2 type transport system permease protein